MPKMIGGHCYDNNVDDDDPLSKRKLKRRETKQWRKDWDDEVSNDDYFWYSWDNDWDDPFESRDLLHRLADDETIAYWMTPKPL